MSLKKILSTAKESFPTYQNNDKFNAENGKKRVSIPSSSEEANMRNSLSHMQESIQSFNFPHSFSFKECFGIDDVVITPTYMEFKDGSEGITMEKILTIQNLGKKAAIIRIKDTNSMTFKIKTIIKNGHRLCPGLSLNRVIRYSFKVLSSTHAMIPIEINGTTLDYHLICTSSWPQIAVKPTLLDFGHVDIGSVSNIKKVTMTNSGGKSARFSVDLGKNEMDLNIQPIKGMVKPNDTMTLAVQVTGKYAGVFCSEFWIKSNPNIPISIKMNVIKPKLIISHPTTMDSFSLLKFTTTFLETRRHIDVPLRNSSSQVASFVILNEVNDNLIGIREINTKEYPTFDAFRIYPVEGILQPFEEVTLSINFSPTLKNLHLLRKQSQNKNINYFIEVIKIYKIRYTEAKDILKKKSINDMSIENQMHIIHTDDTVYKENDEITMLLSDEKIQPEITTIYLHGDIENARLEFSPDAFQLGDLNIADKIQRSIRIRNPSKHLSLTFSFLPKPYIRCEPRQARLSPNQSVEVLVTITVQFNLEPQFNLEFNIFAESMDENPSNKMKHINIARSFVQFTYNPLKAAGKIKFSNNICKTVSLNKLTLDPDYSMTYTLSKLEIKLNHREYWTHYLRSIFSHPERNINIMKESACNDDYEIHCNLPKISKICNTSIAQKSLKEFLELKSCENDEKRSSVPLTPLQIYKIHVSPFKLYFGKVVTKTTSYRQLIFKNKNNFRVMVSLISLDSQTIIFSESDKKIILQPRSTRTCSIEFQAQNVGQYSSFLNYVINNNHKYQLPITAYVVSKSLTLKTKEVIFENDYYSQEGYRIPFKVIEIENKLNANTKFKWSLPSYTNFTIEPSSGVVPANRRLCISVYHALDSAKLNRAEAVMLAEGGGRAYLKLEAPLRAPNVVGLMEGDALDVGEVPLNLEHRVTAVLYNAEHYGAFFEIDERVLLRGIVVTPVRGTIAPRGIVILNICLKFDTCIQFSTLINIIVQKCLNLQLKLHGSVAFPKLFFKPNKIEIKRINLMSYQVQEIVASNLTNSSITIKFLLKEYPEFRMSLSALKSADYINNEQIITIPPSTTVKLFLHVTPCDLASYSFYLPIVINELLGPVPSGDNNFVPSKFFKSLNEFYTDLADISILSIPTKLPTIWIDCTVTYPVISFNKLLFNFNNDIQQDELKVRNYSKEDVFFILITESCNNPTKCSFTISWSRGGVEPKLTKTSISCLLLSDNEACFKIMFKPKEPGHCICELPINLGNIEGGQMYNKLILSGSYSMQRIESDILEIYLVPVPLKILTKERFILQLYDFMKPTYICAKVCYPEKCSGVFSEETLIILFTNGVSIKPCSVQEIPVEIQFKSSVPVSFYTKVIFYDIENLTSYSIMVYGASDHSLLSTYIYEETLNKNFCVTKQQKFPLELMLFTQTNENFSEKQIIELGSKAVSFRSSISLMSKYELREERIHSLDSQKLFNSNRKENTPSFDLTVNSLNESTKSLKSFYPFFPANERSDKQTPYMYRTINAVEKWLYANVLQYQFNMQLTDGITVVLSGIISHKMVHNNKTKIFPIPYTFIDVVKKYLIDINDISEIGIGLREGSEYEINERRNDVLNNYHKILQYLLSKGACIAHISPEFLLTYSDYKELQSNSNYLLPEYAFLFRSKQSWLDLILQSYKSLILNQIDETLLETHVNLINDAINIDSFTYKRHNLNIIDIVNRSKKHVNKLKSEAILLSWLEYICTIIFDTRTINDFKDCLNDGLAFIATTLLYCPFLKDEFFKDIYIHPVSSEEKVHNAICLLLAWKKIRLGFIITPSEIINPNCIQMLMLTVHLFQNLPRYLIKNKITFSCALTKIVTRSIKSTVPSNYPINYSVQFFGNDIDTFSSKPIVSIKPGKNQHIKITYHARKIMKTTVYLLLCGSVIGPHFAENQAFLLEGYPDELEISGEYTIRSKLYQIVEKKLNISVPYDYQTKYDIWLCDQRPCKPEQLKMTRWTDLQVKKTPRRLVLNEESIIVQENSHMADLALTIACMISESRSYWIIFQSKIADFIIQINSSYVPSITDHVTIELIETECICPDLPKQIMGQCPLNKKFVIPLKNINLQNCLLQMFKKSLLAEEEKFWTNCIDNIIGLRLIKIIMKDTEDSDAKEFRHMDNSSLSYNITVDKTDVLLSVSFTIQDNENSDGKIELTVHISEIKSKLSNAHITLRSLNKKEVRVCKVDFLSEKSITDSLQQK